jgi:hypothetical protein
MNFPMPCSDNNECTIDSCDPATGCVYTPVNINDNNACTTDACDTLTGAVTHTAIVCNDNSVCTTDSCDPASGCVYTPISCDDGNACTADSCDAAVGCIHASITCDDGNACTTDSCNPASGCVTAPIVCNDGNACTTDSCDPATGCVTAPVVCNDGNACTTDTCDPATGCVYTVDPNCNTCPADQYSTVTIDGGGQNPSTVDKQVQTSFTVVGNSGCIVSYTKSKVVVTPGTILLFDCKVGNGPQPGNGTWQGNALAFDPVTHEITCPAATGDVGKLIVDNKSNGGSDTDRITVAVQ